MNFCLQNIQKETLHSLQIYHKYMNQQLELILNLELMASILKYSICEYSGF